MSARRKPAPGEPEAWAELHDAAAALTVGRLGDWTEDRWRQAKQRFDKALNAVEAVLNSRSEVEP